MVFDNGKSRRENCWPLVRADWPRREIRLRGQRRDKWIDPQVKASRQVKKMCISAVL